MPSSSIGVRAARLDLPAISALSTRPRCRCSIDSLPCGAVVAASPALLRCSTACLRCIVSLSPASTPPPSASCACCAHTASTWSGWGVGGEGKG
eukprot:scaffold10693_cov70-Phaeocystis_antarctica.AAC.1